MMRHAAIRVTASLFITGLLLSCGAGGAGSAVRPSDPTAREALGESCPIVADYGQPLIVDWKSHERANLEEAMAGGVAVVSYDCHSLRLLSGCHIAGAYSTLGVSRKEEVIELENVDEIRANLPTLGGKVAMDFKAEIQRGSSLNLAMILIAKKRTTVRLAERGELSGVCDGATHFVRGAFMGAFAMGTATRGKVRAIIDVFGTGIASESGSTKSLRNQDGDPRACASVKPESSSLPPGCSAILRLELAPVTAGARESPTKIAAGPVSPPPCPQGMTLSEGKCTKPSASRAHDCVYGSPECATECAKGSNQSCVNLGAAYLEGNGVPKDPQQAFALFAKACDAGNLKGCAFVGGMYGSGLGVVKDSNRALAINERVCAAGEPAGCLDIAAHYSRAGDHRTAIKYRERGCDAGDPSLCEMAATTYKRGELGVAKDPARAAAYFKKACDGDAEECYSLAEMYESGSGVPKDQVQALSLFRKACDAGSVAGCYAFNSATGDSRPLGTKPYKAPF